MRPAEPRSFVVVSWLKAAGGRRRHQSRCFCAGPSQDRRLTIRPTVPLVPPKRWSPSCGAATRGGHRYAAIVARGRHVTLRRLDDSPSAFVSRCAVVPSYQLRYQFERN